MKCDMCGNERAVVFVQQIDGDTHSELRLCSGCAKLRGLTRAEGELSFSVKELLESLSNPVDQGPQANAPGPVCPVCASRLTDLKETARAGCPACYETFADELFSRYLIGRYGSGKKTLRHVGRFGVMKADLGAPGTEVPILKERLRLALVSEDYETAALCRDRILKLETSRGA